MNNEAERLAILFTTCEGTLTGATQSTFYLAEGLAKRGHRIFVACPADSLLYSMLGSSSAKRVPVPFKGKFDLASIRAIRDLVRENGISIINAQSSADRYISIFANRLFELDLKVVHTRRQLPMSSGGWLQRKFYIGNTEKIVVVSESLKKTFVKNGYPESHLEVIFNGMTPDFFERASESKTATLREKYQIEKNEVIVGCISRFKNQAQLIAACRFLPESYTLMFVGIEVGAMDAFAKEFGIKNRIIYAGIVPREEVVDYYRIFDVFVLPSTMDGFGLVLVEAMGLGVPVIGTRSQGIIDVIDNEKNGLWFEDGNVEELARKIILLVDDGNIKRERIANGLEAAHSRFTIQKTIDNYEAFFRSILRN